MSTFTAPQLRLVDDEGETVNHHCPICNYVHHAQDAACAYGQSHKNNSTFSLNTESSYYTARSTTSTKSDSGNTSIKAKIKILQQKEAPSLRRKTSTREYSLRELRKKQSQQWSMRTKRSEELLQQVYEAQIRAYLDTPVVVTKTSRPSTAELVA